LCHVCGKILLTPTLYQTAQKSVTPDESFSDMTEGRNEQMNTLKGLVHPKIKMMSLMMSCQAQDLIHLQNTVQDILDLVRELSVPPLKMYVRSTVLVQKGNKDIM